MYIRKIEELGIDIERSGSLKRYNTFKIDQKSKSICRVNNLTELKQVVGIFNKNDEIFTIIGKGSNVLFTEKALNLNFIVLSGDFNKYHLNEESSTVEVGAAMGVVPFGVMMARSGLSGLEFAHGIPGTIGGAVAMNAGAHGSEFSNIIKEVTVLDKNRETIDILSKDDMKFEYRNSIISNESYIILSAILELSIGNNEKILKNTKQYKDYRMKTQPLKKRTCGSVFKNPLPDYSAELLERFGFKGYRIGTAKFSDLHSNFIELDDNGDYKDVLKLIEIAEKEIKLNTGKILSPEVKLI